MCDKEPREQLKLDMLPKGCKPRVSMDKDCVECMRRQAESRRKRAVEDGILMVLAILCMVSLIFAEIGKMVLIVQDAKIVPVRQDVQIEPELTYITPSELEEEAYYDSLELLAICVEAEAGNQGMLGKRLVVDVILNRVEDSGWPDTIEGVISQKYQFSSYWDGGMDRAIPTDETFEAVALELEERSYPDIYYFRAGKYPNYGTPWKRVGDHYFSTK